MTLRPYQQTAIVSALDALTKGGSAVLQMPTGGGKTRVASDIILRERGPVWFVCHRQEIERQAAKAFSSAGIDFGIVSPRSEPEYDKTVQIVSVATLSRKIEDLPAPKLVIWDECHHVAAASWAKIRDALPNALHLGLTATPERLDGKGLGKWFSHLIIGPSMRELIDGGYLSEFRYFAPSDPDLTAARMQAGDYKKCDLAKIMNAPVLIGDAVSEYKEKANGKRAIVFCASVEASQALVDRFNAEGVPAFHVDGTTPTAVRDRAVEDLSAGRINVLSNVEVFTEGFDLPAIDAVFLLRPTKSVALFLQMIGRALRKSKGKDAAIIFDHAGLWLEHGWFDTSWDWSLEGGARKRHLASIGDGRLRRCPMCKEVRQERVESCSCGYQFQSGREIGEFDGQLMELRKKLAEGHVKTDKFLHALNISGWQRIQLRSHRKYGASVNVRAEMEELRKLNLGFIPPLFSSRREDYVDPSRFKDVFKMCLQDFEAAVGSPVRRHANGWIHGPSVRKGMEAVSSKLVPLPEFNRQLGVSRSYMFKTEDGRRIPLFGKGQGPRWVNKLEALEWVRDNTNITIPPEAWPAANDNVIDQVAA